MKSGYWFCIRCGENYATHGAHDHFYYETHDDATNKPKCVICEDRRMIWIVPEVIRDNECSYDKYHHCYRTSVGDLFRVDSIHECLKCFGPSKEVKDDVHGIIYKCDYCGQRFAPQKDVVQIYA